MAKNDSKIPILIKKARIIDPSQDMDLVGDLLVEKGKIKKIAESITDKTARAIEAEGMILAPGFIDMHAHLREPGREEVETIETGLASAIYGGFTSVCAMPNTDPPCDTQAQVRFFLDRAREVNLANLLPVGTITKKRAGKELSEMGELKEAGAVAVSDDGDSVQDGALMRRAMEYASMVDLLVITHCEDSLLAAGGVMHEAYWSTVLGLGPIPAEAESIMVERDIQLAEMTGARVHIAHVSTEKSVDIIREAKKRGIKVTAEACPHHFTLTDEDVKSFNTNLKVNPPLRTEGDVKALKAGLADGTIDVIATDHAPHLESEKEKEFDYAPFGMIGLETALSLSVEALIEEAHLDWSGLVRKLSLNPARILGLEMGTLKEGRAADIVIIDPEAKWRYTRDRIKSKSENTPFIGREMKALVKFVLVDGREALADEKLK